MKKCFVLAVTVSALLLTSCLTVNQKKIIAPPYAPPVQQGADAGEKEKMFYVYYSPKDKPVIDGNFADWDGLQGVHARRMVYGGLFNPEDTDGLFVVRADDQYLYVYARIDDNDPEVNTFPAPQAWRGDSVEFFFGTDTSRHTFYKSTDHRVRIVPQSKTNKSAYDFSIDDVSIKNSDIKVAVVYSDKGYQIEAAIPFSLMGVTKLRIRQNVRGDFQINDADNGKERSRLIHWNSGKDNTYLDASSWGNGRVAALDNGKGEVKK